VRVRVHLVDFALPGGAASIGPTLAAVGRAADDAGVANLSLMDHYFQLETVGAAGDPLGFVENLGEHVVPHLAGR
jgi:hypothetical protein